MGMHSIFDLFRVSIGPSSTRTSGPMLAGKTFVEELKKLNHLASTTEIVVRVYGLLAATAKEYITREAIIVGMSGFDPKTVDINAMPGLIIDAANQGLIRIDCGETAPCKKIPFTIDCIDKYLPLHRNAIIFQALNGKKIVHSNTYCSIGYGMIVDEEELRTRKKVAHSVYPYGSAFDLVTACNKTGLSISAITLKHERTLRTDKDIEEQVGELWSAMQASIKKGLNVEGVLPGPFEVPRRAALLYRRTLVAEKISRNPAIFMDWVNSIAMSVSEENAAGGRVVTAPTNGACGIIPAVISYFDKYIHPVSSEIVLRFLMTAGMIGLLYKSKSSILGSEMGCQGEIGVACSMAAGGLAEILGGSPLKVCNAAEIGMEHNLGLTCDPVNAQVQIPCIERNAIAAAKAINAANMAIQRTSDQYVSLDKVIEAMYETGKDMNIKYRETYRGGLSTKVLRRKL